MDKKTNARVIQKRYEVPLPFGMFCITDPPLAVSGNREEIEALIATCQTVVKQREWRQWDVAEDEGGIFVRIGGQTSMHDEHCWQHLSGKPVFRSDSELPASAFFLNLLDVLVQGPVLIGLSEEEAGDVLCAMEVGPKNDTVETIDHVGNRLRIALATYRRQKNHR